MVNLATDTFKVPDDLTGRDDARALYVRSYLHIRRGVGVLGIALPLNARYQHFNGSGSSA